MKTHEFRLSGTARGFTLIELMIVCAIVAILAAVAYPSYRDSVLKGKRAEGRAAVLDLLQQQERFLTQSNSYMSFAGGDTGAKGTIATIVNGSIGPVGSQTIPFKTTSGDTPTSAAYQVGAQACPGNPPPTLRECVEVFAAPSTAGSDPTVDRIWARSTGEKGCDGSVKTACWK